jgi:hypothetical protein
MPAELMRPPARPPIKADLKPAINEGPKRPEPVARPKQIDRVVKAAQTLPLALNAISSPKPIKNINQAQKAEAIEQARLEFETILAERIQPARDQLINRAYQIIEIIEPMSDDVAQLFRQLNLPPKESLNLKEESDIKDLDNSDLVEGLEDNPRDFKRLTLVELFNQECIKIQKLMFRMNYCFKRITTKVYPTERVKVAKGSQNLTDTSKQTKKIAEENQTRFAPFRDKFTEVSKGYSRISSNISPYLIDGFSLDNSFNFNKDDFHEIEVGFDIEDKVSMYLSQEESVLFAVATPMCSKIDTRRGVKTDLITFEKNKDITPEQQERLEYLVEQITYYSYYFSLIRHYDPSQGEALAENFKHKLRREKSRLEIEREMKKEEAGEIADYSFLDHRVKGENLAMNFPLELAPANQIKKFKKGQVEDYSVQSQFLLEEEDFLKDPSLFEDKIEALSLELTSIMFEYNITARRIQIKTNINSQKSADEIERGKYPGIIGPLPYNPIFANEVYASLALGTAKPELLFGKKIIKN